MAPRHKNDEDDRDILRGLTRADAQALERLLRKYGPRAKGWLTQQYGRILKEPEIDEALNRAAYRVWCFPQKYDDSKSTLGGWFLRNAQWEALGIICGESRRLPLLPPDFPDPVAQPSESEGVDPWVEALWDVINGMPRLQRLIITADLKAGGEADVESLVEQFQTTVGSVYTSRSVGRAQIKREFERRRLWRPSNREAG
jgi:DNA-directed RNA polymerase specialized sigma24 family protein